ncbi:hypothetical protein JG688_00018279 [Phytophthora aleatoria]|uniref:Uncharacterized protein n=1 Tax=Phytophthora aleatoria TaxID=2496075 RepID=A0A8J5IB60_9STRA|nr:hypothetical protein JG688_00018279 [Phytophthora aleatoria]
MLFATSPLQATTNLNFITSVVADWMFAIYIYILLIIPGSPGTYKLTFLTVPF